MDHRPNFIVIHTDQHRGDCLGVTGRRKGLYTPNLDSIAHQGIQFSSCYASCPVCIPQRWSLLTGQEPATHGVLDNVAIPFVPFETTLPTEMGRGGYQTALVGRTMHTYPFSHPYGFEYYLPGDPSSEFKDSKDPFFTYLRDNNSSDCGGYYGCGASNNSRVGAPFHLEDHFHQTKWATNRALDFLDQRDNSRPFMLFIGYYAPHSPLNPPEKYFNMYYNRDDLDEPFISDWDIPPVNSGPTISPYINLKDEELRAARAGYYGNITFLDNQIGRILEKLTFMPNTYLIFTSDHGELLGDHYAFHKSRPYQGSVHIPFLIKGPGMKGSRVIDRPIGWQDIMPTILDLANLPVPDSVDGNSLAPLLKIHEDNNIKWRDYIHGECIQPNLTYYGVEGQTKENNLIYEEGAQYLTDGRMKYIWYSSTGREQLFDIANDYGEYFDLSDKAEYSSELTLWRHRLIQCLKNRPEGFTDGKQLIAGIKPVRLHEKMQNLQAQRKREGYQIAYERPSVIPDAKDYRNILR